MALEFAEDGEARIVSDRVPIELGHGALAEEDRGSYLVVLELRSPARLEVGSLGELPFAPGWYVYAGSAQRALSKRLARHRRGTGKRFRWHIDYLVPHANATRCLPIASYEDLEHELAAALARIGGEAVRGFGSSDCSCPSHLFRFEADPMGDRAFLDLLFWARHEGAFVGREE